MSEVTIELVMARIEEGGKTLRLNVLGSQTIVTFRNDGIESMYQRSFKVGIEFRIASQSIKEGTL